MGNVEKPVEIFHIIEHFCLGRRRLHLFGRDSTIRPGQLNANSIYFCFFFYCFSLCKPVWYIFYFCLSGWLTVGPTLTNSNFNPESYASYFGLPNSHLSGCTEEIERLRPKSPPAKLKSDRGGGAPRGGRGGPNTGRGGERGRERNRPNFRGDRGGFRGRGGPHRGFLPR